MEIAQRKRAATVGCGFRRHLFVIVYVLSATFAQSSLARNVEISPAVFELARRNVQTDIASGKFEITTAPEVDDAERARRREQRLLGAFLFSDRDLSLLRNQSCANCHQLSPAKDPKTGLPLQAPGFVDADNVERGTPVSDGSVARQFGSLNAPSIGYAMFSPRFHFDRAEGLYVGGQFWNGRAASLAEQAGMPFLNPAEMAMPNKGAVVSRLREKWAYTLLFSRVYNINIARNLTPAETLTVYDDMSEAIAAFERTRPFARFTSKFDYYVAGLTELSPKERLGLELFNGKALCAECHISTPTQNARGRWIPALFTDFTYDNIGAPRNLNIPGNPAPDRGLGGRVDIAAKDPDGLEIGKHKVMSLRNIAITAPYGHNGVFQTLEQITHFYNTRDTLGRVQNNRDPGFGVTGWPAPEVTKNVNTDELGKLGLTAREEAAIVAFMKTLTDGYPYWGNDPKVPPNAPSPYAR